ncbi:MAG: acetylglutamate kinase [Deltaproteobacteria bacterium]|nr:acetylglutamate kinase [Deltaproteobacteria bacterium]
MASLISKAETLVEAIPYIEKFRGRVIVIKAGGHGLETPEIKSGLATDVQMLWHLGVNPIVVHGGGPQITHLLESLGVTSRFVRGLRVTDDTAMNVVEMALVGSVNQEIVGLMNRGTARAVGISGKDAGLIRVRRMSPVDGVDLGRVGEVASVNTDFLAQILAAGYIPVIAPTGIGDDGLCYNLNADHVAGAVAAAMQADKLIIMTNVEGLFGAKGELVSSLTAKKTRSAIASGHVKGGMIPKLECCLTALNAGVLKAHIIDGRVAHATLLEIYTDEGIGTEITP